MNYTSVSTELRQWIGGAIGDFGTWAWTLAEVDFEGAWFPNEVACLALN